MHGSLFYLGEFVLHVREDVEEASDCVPQPAVRQGQLVPLTRTLQHTRRSARCTSGFRTATKTHKWHKDKRTASPHLDVLRDAAEDLRGDSDGPAETLFASGVNCVFARVVPVEVHDRLLYKWTRRGRDKVIFCHQNIMQTSTVVEETCQLTLLSRNGRKVFE